MDDTDDTDEIDELRNESHIRTPSIQPPTHGSDYPEINGELSTIYDDTEGSIEIGSIRPISAPSQSSIYNEFEEISRLDGIDELYEPEIDESNNPDDIYEPEIDESNNPDEISSLHTQDNNFNESNIEYRYNPSITSSTYNQYNAYNLYNNNLQPRTVPPFYDNTTHREEYTWKYAIPDRFLDLDEDDYYYERYNRQGHIPEFEEETTNRATYQEIELTPASRESSIRESARSRRVAKFDGQTTHREAFTPKNIQNLHLTSSTVNQTIRRPQVSQIESFTTNQRDYIKRNAKPARIIQPPKDSLQVGRSRSMTPSMNRANFVQLNNGCPAEKALRSGIRHAKQKHGHYYFQIQPRTKSTKNRHDSAPTNTASNSNTASNQRYRRTKSTNSSKTRHKI